MLRQKAIKTLTTMCLLSASLVMSFSCGDEEEETAASPTALTAAQFKGTWTSECIDDDGNYEIRQVAFDKTLVTFSSVRYSDDTCDTVVDSVFQSGIFESAGVINTELVSGATAMDYVFHQATWTFTSEPSNANIYAIACESEASGTSVDVLDKTCITGENEVAFYREAFGSAAILPDGLVITDFNSNGDNEDDRSEDLNPDVFLEFVEGSDQQQQSE